MPKVTIKVPKRSGFDKSHKNLLTTQCGTLTPILVDELVPNSKVYLKDAIQACLPPLASDTYMRVNLKIEAFFVPTRLLYGGYENWITQEKLYNSVNNRTYSPLIPILDVTSSDVTSYFGAGSLGDYLGIRSINPVGGASTYNIFPFLAYHKVYDDWYRNTLVQTPVFQPMAHGDSNPSNLMSAQIPIYALPYSTLGTISPVYYEYACSSTFADGVKIVDLRQRNFGFDYFTCAYPSAQLGNAQSVSFSTSGSTGSFTIASLRAANSLQQFAERNQLAGTGRMQDWVKANYGANLSSGVAQRTILLGSAEIPMYSKGVYQTGNGTQTGITNPFADSVGAEFGSASCNGVCDLVSDFTAEEPGYLMVLASMVPVVTYATGIERMMMRYNAQNSQVDMATPILQNVGHQPVYQYELTGNVSSTPAIFGYVDRYADFKYRNDQLHGILRDGESLESFALQRTVTGSPTLSSAFLQIPTTYMDQVSAVNATISNYGCWIDCYHDYKVSMPLSEYSIPSLQDPAYEHGNDVDVHVGGSRL